jgi:hypothetical protein
MKLPLIGALLNRVPGRVIDERFLDHRRRSSTFAAMAGALVSGGLFEYELVRHHRINRELFAVLIAMVLVKLTAMVWFRFSD